MMKKNNIQDEIELKKLFNSIKTEKPSGDFTLSVMERISKENIAVVNSKFKIPPYYYYFLIPFIAILCSIPFLINWLSDIKFEILYSNISFIETWIIHLLKNSQRIFTPAILSISIASLILSIFFVFTNIADSRQES
jgi:hypothetical protein